MVRKAGVVGLCLAGSAATAGGANWAGTLWIDSVAYNPSGELNGLIPEPVAGAAVAMIAGRIARGRRHAVAPG
jgi:hypothetical protein